jgi:hypothetical protein
VARQSAISRFQVGAGEHLAGIRQVGHRAAVQPSLQTEPEHGAQLGVEDPGDEAGDQTAGDLEGPQHGLHRAARPADHRVGGDRTLAELDAGELESAYASGAEPRQDLATAGGRAGRVHQERGVAAAAGSVGGARVQLDRVGTGDVADQPFAAVERQLSGRRVGRELVAGEVVAVREFGESGAHPSPA